MLSWVFGLFAEIMMMIIIIIMMELVHAAVYTFKEMEKLCTEIF